MLCNPDHLSAWFVWVNLTILLSAPACFAHGSLLLVAQPEIQTYILELSLTACWNWLCCLFQIIMMNEKHNAEVIYNDRFLIKIFTSLLHWLRIIKNLTVMVQIPFNYSSFINDSFSICDQVVVEFQVCHDESNDLQFQEVIYLPPPIDSNIFCFTKKNPLIRLISWGIWLLWSAMYVLHNRFSSRAS